MFGSACCFRGLAELAILAADKIGINNIGGSGGVSTMKPLDDYKNVVENAGFDSFNIEIVVQGTVLFHWVKQWLLP